MPAIVGDGVPFTAVGVSDGTQLATYKLPDLGTFAVSAVVAQIDGSAAPSSSPILRLRDKSGAVIATKRQGSSIPAGDTGSATWALRLADDGAAGATGITRITSVDGSVTVANPTGPTADLHVNFPAIAAARFLGYVLYEVLTLPSTIRYSIFYTVVGAAPPGNGITIANYYTHSATWTVAAGDVFLVAFGSGRPEAHTISGYVGYVENLATGQQEELTGGAPVVVPAHSGGLYNWAHNHGAALLDYTNPAMPRFIAAGRYAVTLNYNISF